MLPLCSRVARGILAFAALRVATGRKMSILNIIRRWFAAPGRPTLPAAIPHQPIHDDLMLAFNEIVQATSDVLTAHRCEGVLDPQEVLAFGTAVVSHLYTLGQRSVIKATPMLDSFHLGVQHMMEQRFRDPARSGLNEAAGNRVLDDFFDLLRKRYPEYKKAISEALLRKDQHWFGLSQLVIDNVIADRLSSNKKTAVVVPLSLRLHLAMLVAMDTLFPKPDFTPIQQLSRFDGEPDMPAWTHGEPTSRALFPESRKRRTAEPPAPPPNPQSEVTNPQSDAPPATPKQ